MRYALVIPALNEQEAIAGTLRRALAAREKVIAATPVKQMTIVFVNDGSTDRTQEIVDGPEFKDVVKVHFKRNRGYGAAIKAGWQAADADLVGLIDADGTCDPDFSVTLINQMLQQNADVVLAARLAPNTRMPLIRQIGNRLFATLLGAVSGHNDITDTASGYRIVKRDKLKLMSPLPDGLHFTPAMSCICLLDPRLKIVEVSGMHYKDREGRSKLSVIRDGFRFLYTILFSACCYSPIKTMLMASAIVAIMTALLAGAAQFLTHHKLPTGIILTTGMLGCTLLICTGLICHQLNFLLIGPRRETGPAERLLQNLTEYKRLIIGGMIVSVVGILAMIIVGAVRWPTGLQQSVAMLLSALLTIGGGLMAMGGVIVRVIWAVAEKQKAVLNDEYEVKTRPSAASTSVNVSTASANAGAVQGAH